MHSRLCHFEKAVKRRRNDIVQEPVMQSPFGFAQAKLREVISSLQRIRAPNWGSSTSIVMFLQMQELRAQRDSYTSSPGLNPPLV